MTIENLIITTNAFQTLDPAIQEVALSKSMIGLFKDAHACKVAGFTYEDWEKQSGAGKAAKAIIKEFFQA